MTPGSVQVSQDGPVAVLMAQSTPASYRDGLGTLFVRARPSPRPRRRAWAS